MVTTWAKGSQLLEHRIGILSLEGGDRLRDAGCILMIALSRLRTMAKSPARGLSPFVRPTEWRYQRTVLCASRGEEKREARQAGRSSCSHVDDGTRRKIFI